MKKGFIFGIILLLFISLCGCGGDKSTDTSAGTSSEEVTSVSSTVEVTETSVDEPVITEPVAEESLALFAENIPLVYYTDGDLEPLNIEWMEGSVCAISGKYIIYYYHDFDTDKYIISAYDTEGDAIVNICETDNFEYADVYENIIYIIGYDYDNACYIEEAYDLVSQVSLPNSQQLYEELKGFRIFSYKVGNVGKACVRRMLNECGFLCINDGEKLYRYVDGEMTEIMDMSFFSEVVAYDNNWVFTYEMTDDYDKYQLNVYDVTGDGITYISNAVSEFLGYKDGVAYFSETDDCEYGLNKYLIYAYDTRERTTRCVSMFEKHAGVPEYGAGTLGFTIGSNYIYSVYDDGKIVSWYVLPKNGPEFAEPAPTAMYIASMGFNDFGHVEAISTQEFCDKCGEYIFRYYYEYLVINEELTGAAGSLNEKMKQLAVDYLEQERGAALEMAKEADCEEHLLTGGVTVESTIEDVEIISDSLIEVNIDSYWYGGGAHGMPYSGHVVCDLSSGNLVRFKDLYKGSEEELKKTVAEYTANDFASYGEGYSPYYGASWDEVYNEAYETVSIDTLSGYFSEYAFTVEYAPYAMGPFASGFICVYIPYEDLGIELY